MSRGWMISINGAIKFTELCRNQSCFNSADIPPDFNPNTALVKNKGCVVGADGSLVAVETTKGSITVEGQGLDAQAYAQFDERIAAARR